MTETIRIFVGCSANGEDAEAQLLLDYTLRKHASRDVELHWMKLSRDPHSPWYSNPKKREGWNTEGWQTPFSAFRFAIPHVCNFQGRAIYVDVDQIFCADVAELWDQPIGHGKAALMKHPHTCVMLFDNARMHAVFADVKQLKTRARYYHQVRDIVRSVADNFHGDWNCHDGNGYATLNDPQIKLIHFTRVETQPHLKWALPRLHANKQKHWGEYYRPIGLPHARADVRPLIDKLYDEAISAGFCVDNYLPKAEEMFGAYHSVRQGPRAA